MVWFMSRLLVIHRGVEAKAAAFVSGLPSLLSRAPEIQARRLRGQRQLRIDRIGETGAQGTGKQGRPLNTNSEYVATLKRGWGECEQSMGMDAPRRTGQESGGGRRRLEFVPRRTRVRHS
ncbi:hypothetical protein CKO23_03185 [Thiocystis violacea]|nr:hypothetical protein [Thiocystis violacea]